MTGPVDPTTTSGWATKRRDAGSQRHSITLHASPTTASITSAMRQPACSAIQAEAKRPHIPPSALPAM